ncbi:caspase family protein [Nocardia asiatica]|uniref:caspase family protein n=1 Tax=Nocardia asiatica TaxID=209252 RepID=UPI003EE3FAB7
MTSLPDPARSRAVLIGVHAYDVLDDLPAVRANLEGLHGVFTNQALWGLPDRHCVVVSQPRDARAVLDRVRQAATEATDTLVVYYAGHGLADPYTDELCLTLPDSVPARGYTTLRYEELRRVIVDPAVSATRKVVVLDCCYSGRALLGGMSASESIADEATAQGTYVLTASAETRKALAPPGEPFTAFTGELIETLSTGIPGGPELLDMDSIYRKVHRSLSMKSRPLPQARNRNTGGLIALVRNVAVSSTVSAVELAVISGPATPISWWPDRQMYTTDAPPTHPRWNSISDNPRYGDERNFMRVRDVSADAAYADRIELKPGGEYEISVFYRNDSPAIAASFTRLRVEVPPLIRPATSHTGNFARTYLRASNTLPVEVTDCVTFTNNTLTDIALRYKKGSATVENDGHNRQIDGTELFTVEGIRLGTNPADNYSIPGGAKGEGRVSFRLVADHPGFMFQNQVRREGTKEWFDSLTVNSGDRVEFALAYANTGSIEQQGVVMKASWPPTLQFVPGSAELVNGNNPNGKRLGGGINGDGVNIGSYSPGASAYLYFTAIATGSTGDKLDLLAAVETINGNRRATSTVTIF